MVYIFASCRLVYQMGWVYRQVYYSYNQEKAIRTAELAAYISSSGFSLSEI